MAEESEARRHDALPGDAVGSRRTGGDPPKVLSVRLTAEQHDRLAALAATRDLPISTMARLAILETLDSQHAAPGPVDTAVITEALREVIRPEFLRAG
ncbi:hypothetical protein IF651_11375 [Cellulosimicrobium arenosum]|uniref:Uncharacterized protein n=2 Tax=Cellulosimicrobium arenosum TaxID=2708133 RepID=A0A927J0L2_9MICO|nr:hypothetical protein [Cellulosimicrobium arenosum]